MAKIIGSIDNAGQLKGIFYLIFTEDEMLKFETMSSKERRFELYQARMSNSMRMVPVAGDVTSYNIMKETVENMIVENIGWGQDIEKDLDEYLQKPPPEFERFSYDDITSVELSGGTAVTLPHLIFKLSDNHEKFHLLHGNFKGRGKIEDDVFKKYEDVLKEALPGKLEVK